MKCIFLLRRQARGTPALVGIICIAAVAHPESPSIEGRYRGTMNVRNESGIGSLAQTVEITLDRRPEGLYASVVIDAGGAYERKWISQAEYTEGVGVSLDFGYRRRLFKESFVDGVRKLSIFYVVLPPGWTRRVQADVDIVQVAPGLGARETQ